MSDEWGPWIEHDGKHMPPDGSLCQAAFDDGKTLLGVVRCDDETHRDSFLWCGDISMSHVIRYRIRKPRGMAILEGLLADLPGRERGSPRRVTPLSGRACGPVPSAAIIITRYVPAGPRSQAEGQGTPLTGPLKAAANHTPCFTLPTAPPASCWGLFLAPALA